MSARLSPVRPANGSCTTRVYRRRRPERTALYQLAQQHLETWLAARREADPDGVPIPRHIERELRGYLDCGILACDLARWGHGGGFSLHAAGLIEPADRPGLERLLRYCARPAFASERLSWDGSISPSAIA